MGSPFNQNDQERFIKQLSELSRDLPDSLRSALDTVLRQAFREQTLSEGNQRQLALLFSQFAAILSDQAADSSGDGAEKEGEGFRIELLRHIPMFQILGYSDLKLFARYMEDLTLPPGTDLLKQGFPADGVYFIQTGSVAILVNNELVAHRGGGDSFGEMSCLKEEVNASATVRTTTPCQVFRISRELFMETVNRLPPLWQQMFKETSNRLTSLSQRLSEVLMHTPHGLLKVDQKGLITDEYSIKCTELFGRQNLTGMPLDDLLFGAEQHQEEHVGWSFTYPVLYENHSMNFKDLAQLLPNEVLFPHPDGKSRCYALSYFPCRNAEGRLIAVDVGIENITRARELEQISQAFVREGKTMHKVYDHPQTFIQLLESLKQLAPKLRNLVGELERQFKEHQTVCKLPEKYEEIMISLMRELHTLKGSSGMFELNDLRETLHLQEDNFRDIQKNKAMTTFHLTRILTNVDVLEERTSYAFSLLGNLSPDLRKRLTGVVLTQEEFSQLKQSLIENHLENVHALIGRLEEVSAKDLFRQWTLEIEKLGVKLNKKAKLALLGDEVFLPKNQASRLEPALGHILRNCMDHGIQTPAKRKKLGKPVEGCITVQLTQDEEQIRISISDDGSGLNETVITEKARANTLLNQTLVESHIANHEIWKILLLPGFSTAAKVSDLSGRGVGLDAVSALLSELRGSLEIQGQPNEGTTFLIQIPRNH